jgi:hypothetical protein
VIYAVAATGIVMALLGAFYSYKRESERNTRLKDEAPANTEQVDVRRAVSPIFGNEFTVDVSVRYKYEINGMHYEQTVRLSPSQAQAFVPWGSAKICYDPSDSSSIENGELFPNSHKCGDN